MTFYSISFFILFSILILAMRLTKQTNTQLILLFIANAVFYSYWNLLLFLIVIFEICVVYFCCIRIGVKRKRRYVILPTFLVITFLVYFKYLNFFIESFCNAFHVNNSPVLNIILPLGISFYSFQALSYVYDVYYGKVDIERNWLRLAVYISFFPQIVSGPIVKSKDFLWQLRTYHNINRYQLNSGLQIFLIGFIKKKVIADRIGICVDAVYHAPTAYNGISVLIAIIGYAVQIYCDFSGYSDMAIGIARVLGFDLGKNFNAPYISRNPSEFWRRWHISLSTWFKDYLYIPMGGNRKGKLRTYINIFIVMFVSGLWHGANWTFIIWGILHGLGCVAHKLYIDIKRFNCKETRQISSVSIIPIILNNIFVIVLWVVFRADNLPHALSILSSVFNKRGIVYINPYVIFFTVIIYFTQVWCLLKNNGLSKNIILDTSKFKNQLLISIAIFITFAIMYVGNSAFIYAQF